MTGQGEYVLSAVNSFRRPMSNNTLNAAMRRLGYAKDEISVSGFRATASTLLNEMARWIQTRSSDSSPTWKRTTFVGPICMPLSSGANVSR